MSSSVSFAFLLSLIPFATLNMFIVNLIQVLFFPDSVLSDTIRNFLAKELINFIPVITEEWVKEYVFNSSSLMSSFRIINFILLPFVSGLVFKTLESSYRKIFIIPARHMIFSQIFYGMLAIFIVCLLFLTSFTWSIIAAPFMRILTLLNDTQYFAAIDLYLKNNPLLSRINGLSALMIFLFYVTTVKTFIPFVNIKFWQILVSGALFCLLWVAARTLFQLYVENISGVNLLYGSLSSIIIILLWIFYSSLALLLSLELLYVLHIRE